MPEEIYQVTYRTEDQASGRIDRVAAAVKACDTTVSIGTDNIRAFGRGAAAAARNCDQLSKALDQLTGYRAKLIDFVDPIDAIESGLMAARTAANQLGKELGTLQSSRRPLQNIGDDSLRLGNLMAGAGKNVHQLGSDLAALRARTADLESVKQGVVGVQRSAYGAHKNIESLGAGLRSLQSKSAGLSQLRAQLTGVGKGGSQAAAGGRRLGKSLDGLMARIAVVQGVKSAIEGLGQAIDDVREKAKAGAEANLSTRDRYRELANLQGKAEPDNAVIAGALRYRLQTGATDREANDALRRFEGGLPAAVKAGNITGSATEGLASDFLREAGRTGTRVSLSGGTTGLLASKLAQSEKIGSVDQGISRFGAIVDTLNRGDGDLTPLVQALVSGSGGQVGKGRTFGTLGEFAAAQSVASLNASPAASSTRVRQAATALNRFSEHGKEEVVEGKDKDGKKILVKTGHRSRNLAGDALAELGITAKDDFVTRIDKLAPLIEGKDNADASLAEAGFRNSAERKSLLQFYANRKLLRSETTKVREGSDPNVVRAANDRFFQGPDAQNRIAKAQQDAEAFAQHTADEPVEVLRKKAEANLRRKGELDNNESATTEAIADNPATRLMMALRKGMSGQRVTMDELPVGMGGKSFRQRKIDNEAERLANEQARKAGVEPRNLPDFAGDGLTTPEERIKAANKATVEAGGKQFGGTEGTDQTLRALLRETQRTNALLEKNGQPGPMPFLPAKGVPGTAFTGDINQYKAGINQENAFF